MIHLMRRGPPKSTHPIPVGKDRLDSWKEIAACLNRDIRTVQRWEDIYGLPVHRLPGGPKARVFAFRSELDAWLESRATEIQAAGPEPAPEPGPAAPATRRRRRLAWWIAASCVLALVAALACAAVLVRNPQLLLQNLQESRFTPFAVDLTVQTCPAWSPDGKSIAFTNREAGRTRLMVQAVDGATPAAVTGPEVTVMGGGDPVWCRQPFWSPDSQWLYFLGTAAGKSGLHRVAAGGGPAMLVQADAAAGTVSPDGKTLVFLARSDPAAKWQVWSATPPEGSRKRYEPAPFQAASYANIPQLEFAPDGTKIFSLITFERDTQYSLLPWPPAQPRRIFTRTERTVGTPDVTWMPDSRHMVAGFGPLAMADVDSGRYWPIAVHERWMGRPSVSPDGSRIAYQSSLSHADVVAVPFGGGPIATLLGSTAWEQMPAASPVAPQVVYVTDKRGPPEIWIKSLAEGWDRPLVRRDDVRVGSEQPRLLMTPVFSPDGSRIAFTAIAPSGPGLFTVFASGSPPVRVTAGDAATPTWSPDGKWLAFRRQAGGKGRLMKVRVGAGQPPVELGESCGQAMPEWSPTGEWIAHLAGECELALLRPDGQQKRLFGGRGPFAWSRDGQTLFRFRPEKHTLNAVDIATGEERVLRYMSDLLPYSGPQPGLRATLSSDDKSIVFSVLRPREEIWILEDVHIREPWWTWLVERLSRPRRPE
jgi:Tol biopolymer transport system component